MHLESATVHEMFENLTRKLHCFHGTEEQDNLNCEHPAQQIPRGCPGRPGAMGKSNCASHKHHHGVHEPLAMWVGMIFNQPAIRMTTIGNNACITDTEQFHYSLATKFEQPSKSEILVCGRARDARHCNAFMRLLARPWPLSRQICRMQTLHRCSDENANRNHEAHRN